MGCINAKPAEKASLEPNTEASSSDVELFKQRETEHRLEVTFKTKRQNVFTAGVNMDSGTGYKVKNIAKSVSHSELISKIVGCFTIEKPTDVVYCSGNALNNIFIFAAMALEDLQTVVNAMERVEISAGTDVMTQGTFYLWPLHR